MALSRYQYKKAAILGLIAFLLGLSFLCNEVGNKPQVGYFFWIGSIASLLVTAVVRAGQSAAEKSQLSLLDRNHSFGPDSEYLRYEPCERIAPGPPPNQLVDVHIREAQ
jgi:hypothetical protein